MSQNVSKRQDRKASSAQDDEEYDIFIEAPLFAPLRHDFSRQMVIATKTQEHKITEMSTALTRVIVDEDFSVESIDKIIAETESIGEQMEQFITITKRASRRRGASSEVADDID